MHILAKTVHGSRLYGTAGPESDTDLKAVYLPDIKDLILGRVRHNVQVKSENLEAFSLHEFLRLATEGQTMAIEMLFTPKDSTLETSQAWEEIVRHRHRFLSKKINGFVAYAKTMADKYVTRGNRLKAVDHALRIVAAVKDQSLRLGQIWNQLPEGEFLRRGTDARFRNVDQRAYVVCDRTFAATLPLHVFREALEKCRKNFGSRVQAVAEDQGKERKSFAHAFRAGFQLQHLILNKNLPFPLPEAEFLKGIRFGKTPYKGLPEQLEELLKETDRLVAHSDLPDEIDPTWADHFVLQNYQERLAYGSANPAIRPT